MAALIVATLGLPHTTVKAAAIIVDSSRPMYHDDDDLDNLRDDPRFDEFLERSWKRQQERYRESNREQREKRARVKAVSYL